MQVAGAALRALALHAHLIIHLFKHKSITECTIYDCNDDTSTLVLTKMLMHNGLKVTAININKLNDSVSILHWYRRIGVVVNAEGCEGWRAVLDRADPLTHFKSPFSWVVLAGDVTHTARAITRYRIETDSDVTICFKNGNTYDLYEAYHTGFGVNGKFILRQFGYWRHSLFIENVNRMNLQGLVLRAVVVINHNQRVVNETFERFLREARPTLRASDPMHKYKYYEVLQYYRDLFNVSFQYQRTNSWGYPRNGSFDGMVGALQRREADLGGSPLFVRADRAAALDYAAETWQTRPCFVFLSPARAGSALDVAARPLTAAVWRGAVALLALAGALLAAMLRARSTAHTADHPDSSSGLAFLFIWGAVCQQGMALDRRSASVKVLCVSVLVFALTLYQYYTAAVVSALLHRAPPAVRSLRDLLHSDLHAGLEDVLYIRDFFKRTTDPVALDLYRKKVVHNGEERFMSPERGLARVARGGFAFHVDTALAYRLMRYTFTEEQLCAVGEVSMMAPQYLGAAVPRRSPYREHVARAVRASAERGLLARLRAQWDARRAACVRRGAGAGAVSAREVGAALGALAAGLALALVLLALERRLPPRAHHTN